MKGWTKTTSVTASGKSHFYFRRTDLGRTWITWDRLDRVWKYETEDRIIATGETPQEAWTRAGQVLG